MLNQIFVVSAFLCCISSGARILGVFPTPLFSHQSVYQPVWKELSLKGHAVTVITPNPIGDASLVNLTEIDIGAVSRWVLEVHNFSYVINKEKSLLKLVSYVTKLSLNMSKEHLRHPGVKALLENEDTFDLVIVETGNPLWYALSEKYKCPLIGITSMDVSFITHEFLGNPAHPVLYPDFNLPFGPRLDFFERAMSVAYSLYIRHKMYKESYGGLYAVAEQHLNLSRSLQDIEKDMSLVLVNWLFGFVDIRPIVPNIIPLNGLHIRPPKPLNEELRVYLDGAEKGVIYFSLGSNVKSNLIPKWKFDAILEVFAELPYKVLWKFESDLKIQSENVKMVSWLPQQDILRHPNVKLFITQGGLQSIDEAVRFKVPLLGIPFFGDQFHNVKRFEHLGVGLEVDFERFSKRIFRNSILEIITNGTYRSRIEELSDLVTDQPVKPLDKAVWWIEYVIRHKGAQHLQSPGVRMPLYQYYLLDVIGATLIIFTIFLYFTLKVVTRVYRIARRIVRPAREIRLKMD